MVCLLARGHCLLEGVPGVAKTLAVSTIARAVGGDFARLQFTPDLVPSDVVGTRVYRMGRETFDVELGPVFVNFVLADEINRAPAKVQSALLEVMAERQGQPRRPHLPPARAVPRPRDAEPDRVRGRLPAARGAARPVPHEGAGHLPLARRGAGDRPPHGLAPAARRAGPQLGRPAAAAGVTSDIFVHHAVADYAVRLVLATRDPAAFGVPSIAGCWPTAPPRAPASGSSPPAAALALIRGRDYVLPTTSPPSRPRSCRTARPVLRGARGRPSPPESVDRARSCGAVPQPTVAPSSRAGGRSGPVQRPGPDRRDARRPEHLGDDGSAVDVAAGQTGACRLPRRSRPASGASSCWCCRRLEGLLQGNHLGLLPGAGSERAESREYRLGDDVRRMDWAVTARTTIPHVSDMIADRELTTHAVVDLSPSMEFGTHRLGEAGPRHGRDDRVRRPHHPAGQPLRSRRALRRPAATDPRAAALRRPGCAAARPAHRWPRPRGPGSTVRERRRAAGPVARRRARPARPAAGCAAGWSSSSRTCSATRAQWERPMRALTARHQVLAVEVTRPARAGPCRRSACCPSSTRRRAPCSRSTPARRAARALRAGGGRRAGRGGRRRCARRAPATSCSAHGPGLAARHRPARRERRGGGGLASDPRGRPKDATLASSRRFGCCCSCRSLALLGFYVFAADPAPAVRGPLHRAVAAGLGRSAPTRLVRGTSRPRCCCCAWSRWCSASARPAATQRKVPARTGNRHPGHRRLQLDGRRRRDPEPPRGGEDRSPVASSSSCRLEAQSRSGRLRRHRLGAGESPTTDRQAVSTPSARWQLGPATAIGDGTVAASLAAIAAVPGRTRRTPPPPGRIVLLSDGETTRGLPNEHRALSRPSPRTCRSRRSPTAPRTARYHPGPGRSGCRSTSRPSSSRRAKRTARPTPRRRATNSRRVLQASGARSATTSARSEIGRWFVGAALLLGLVVRRPIRALEFEAAMTPLPAPVPAVPASASPAAPASDDAALAASYATCRRLHAAYGRTYYLATMLLPEWKRPYVHALYGFARYADEIVDDPRLDPARRAEGGRGAARPRGRALPRRRSGGRTPPGTRGHDVLTGGADTIRALVAPARALRRVPRARCGWTSPSASTRRWTTCWPTSTGSAAVIGLQMVPILEPTVAHGRRVRPGPGRRLPARELPPRRRRGPAPRPHLSAPGVAAPVRRDPRAAVTRRRGRPGAPAAGLRDRALPRAVPVSAAPGIRLLHPTSRDCIRTAFTLYGGILDEIERADYQVLDRRVSVPLRRRLAVAAPGLWRAARARST